MTENQTDPAGSAGGTATGTPPEGPEQPTSTGWNTEHLKDYRQLRRSQGDRKIAGVAGGLGAHLDVDPTVIRVLFVVLAFFGGAGILAYGALWLVVPEEVTENAVVRTSESSRNGLLIAVAVVAGILALGDTWNGFSYPFLWFPWPLAVVGLVVAVVLLSRDRGASTPVGGPGGPAGPYGPTGPVPPYAAPPPPSAQTQAYPQTQTQAQTPPPPTPTWYPPPPPPIPPRPRRRGPILFGLTLALVALALGSLGLYDAAGGEVLDAAYPALALAVVGTMLVVGAFWGRPGGLVALGLVTALVLAAFSIGEPTFDGDRDTRITPLRATDVAATYHVPAGRIVLDLSRVKDPEALDGRSIDVEANAGELVVILPDDVAADLDASVHYGGRIESPIATRDGWSSSVDGRVGADDADTVIDLEMDLEFGRIVVSQL